jgi:hypothetical protein
MVFPLSKEEGNLRTCEGVPVAYSRMQTYPSDRIQAGGVRDRRERLTPLYFLSTKRSVVEKDIGILAPHLLSRKKLGRTLRLPESQKWEQEKAAPSSIYQTTLACHYPSNM